MLYGLCGLCKYVYIYILYQTSIGEIYGWESDAQKSVWKGQKEGDEWTAEDTNEYLQSFVQ